MKGTRIFPDADGWLTSPPFDEWPPGAYGRVTAPDAEPRIRGLWFVRTPNGLFGTLRHHSVVEHDDGTITVKPQVFATEMEKGKVVSAWHGWLRAGEWTEG